MSKEMIIPLSSTLVEDIGINLLKRRQKIPCGEINQRIGHLQELWNCSPWQFSELEQQKPKQLNAVFRDWPVLWRSWVLASFL